MDHNSLAEHFSKSVLETFFRAKSLARFETDSSLTPTRGSLVEAFSCVRTAISNISENCMTVSSDNSTFRTTAGVEAEELVGSVLSDFSLGVAPDPPARLIFLMMFLNMIDYFDSFENVLFSKTSIQMFSKIVAHYKRSLALLNSHKCIFNINTFSSEEYKS